MSDTRSATLDFRWRQQAKSISTRGLLRKLLLQIIEQAGDIALRGQDLKLRRKK